MDTARYILALVAVVSVPQAVVYWFLIHPFIGFWRRLGKGPTYLAMAVVYVGIGVWLWTMRETLLAVEYGTNRWLWAPALLFYVPAAWIQFKIKKQLTFRVLAGVPELEADGKSGELLQTGLYAHVRHPRYLSISLGMVAWALFTNYLAMYVLVPFVVLGVVAIAFIEERELVVRFGAPYADYRARVPMIFPRFGTR